MPVSNVITYESQGANLDPIYQIQLPVAAWMTTYAAGDVPGDSLPWMLAQGWQIQGIDYDRTTTPPTPYYNLSRQGMITWAVLQSLVNTYTDAYNEGRQKNALRYDQIVANWGSQISQCIAELDLMAGNSNTYVALYTANLTALMNQVNASIAAAQSSEITTYQNVLAQLATYQGLLGQFQANYNNYLAKITPLLSAEAAAQATFQANYPNALANLQSDYNALAAKIQGYENSLNSILSGFIAQYTTQIGLLSSDYTSHSVLSASYFVNLGVAERARIIEQWASTLATETQQLTDRGLYASALLAQITDRNTTLLNRDLTDLNDRLMREQAANEHKLYEQLVAMRDMTMKGLDRIYQMQDAIARWQTQVQLELERELDQARMELLKGTKLEYDVAQDTNRLLSEQQGQLVSQAQKASSDTMGNLSEIITKSLAAGEFDVNTRMRLASLQMEANLNRLKGETETHAQEMELYRYQVDTTNQIIIGLFGFQERRTDSYPSLEIMAQLVSQLGDSSATNWVSP